VDDDFVKAWLGFVEVCAFSFEYGSGVVDETDMHRRFVTINGGGHRRQLQDQRIGYGVNGAEFVDVGPERGRRRGGGMGESYCGDSLFCGRWPRNGTDWVFRGGHLGSAERVTWTM
jgi:hypothetical protein